MEIGGKENLLVDLINNLSNYFQIYVMVINSKKDKSIIERISPRVKTIFVGRPQGSKNPLYVLKFYYFIFKINPHIIHVHDWKLIYLLYPLKLFFKKLLILTLHSVGIKFKNIIRHFNAISCISKAVFVDFKRRCFLCKGLIIYNGVDFNVITVKKYFKGKNFKICQVGRLDHSIKGQHILLKAFKLFLTSYPDSELHFYGDGPSKEYLMNLAKNLGISNKVYFHGKVNRETIYRELHRFSLLVHPSFYEGFGLAIVEALAAKVPVLVADVNGPIELIQRGNYGFYFRKGSVCDCYRKLIYVKEIYDNDTLYLVNLVNKSYIYALNNFSIESIVSKYIRLYLGFFHNKKFDESFNHSLQRNP